MPRTSSALALLFLAASYGCGSDSNPVGPRDIVVTKISGDAQQAIAGQAEAEPLVVSVTDETGAPIANVKVHWGVVSGGGIISASSSTTDEAGNASATWTLGTSGVQSVKAWTDFGTFGWVTFSADAIVQIVTIAAGDAQTGPFAEPLPAPLVVSVTTPSGAPVPNLKVNWGVVAGGGSVSAASSITDQAGKASITWTLGPVTNETVKAWTDTQGSQSAIFSATGEKTLILHFDGATWTRSLLTDHTNVSVSVGWAQSPTFAFAAGGGCQGPPFLTYKDGAWTGFETCAGSSLVMTSMWGTAPNDIWAVGTGNGTRISGAIFAWVYHFNGTDWTTSFTDGDATHPPELIAVGSRSADDVIAVGKNGRIIRHSGSSWLEQTSGTTANLWAVWGDPNSQYVFAVGDAGTVVRNDGTTWQPQPSGTTQQLRGVWGSSATNVFAVGAGGTILHFDGTSWTPQASGTSQDLRAIWGASPTSVYAVGGTALLHYDGTSWSPVSTGFPMTYTGVWGASSTDVFVSGSPILQ